MIESRRHGSSRQAHFSPGARSARGPWSGRLLPFAALALGGVAAAQSAKLNLPLPPGPEANGERIFETALSGDFVVYRADQDARDVFELYSAPLDGSLPPLKLHAPVVAGGDVLSFRVVPGGRVIYCADAEVDEDYGYYSVPVDGSAAPFRLVHDLVPALRTILPLVTDDGSTVVGWINPSTLAAASIDGSVAPRLLASGVDDFALVPGSTQALFIDEGFRVAHLYAVLLDGSQTPVPLSFDQHGTISELRATPDGTRVIYMASGTSGSTGGSVELFSVPSDGSSGRVRLCNVLSSSLNVVSFEISPDSTRVVYLADQAVNGRFELFSAPTDGSQPPIKVSGTTISTGDVAGTPAYEIMPDSSTVVFRANREQASTFRLYRAPLDGSVAPVALSADNTDDFRLDPAGQRAVYRRSLGAGLSELRSVEAVGTPGTPVLLNDPLVSGGTVRSFQISPDALSVAFEAQRDSLQFELYSVPIAGGTPTRELSGPFVTGGEIGARVGPAYAISADSTRAMYLADQELDELVELFGVPLDGSAPAVKLSGPLDPGPVAGDVGAFQLSQDGEHFVFWGDAAQDQVFELFAGPLDGSQPPVRINAPLGEDRLVPSDWKLTPDGNFVVFTDDHVVDQQYELYRARVDGTEGPVRLSNPIISADVRQFWVSPTGAHVVYLLSDDLYGVPLAGGVPALALNGGIEVQPLVTFLPDGSRILFTSPPSAPFSIDLPARLYSVPLAGGPLLELSGPLQNPADVSSLPVPSRRGEVLYLADAAVDERFDLFKVSASGSSSRVKLNRGLVAGGDVLDMVFSPGGRFVVYRADAEVDNVIELYGFDTLAPRARRLTGPAVARHVKLNLALAATDDVSRFLISPDGARAVFTVRDAGSSESLFVVPVDGSASPVALSGPNHAVLDLRFTPGGERIVYVASVAASGRRLFSALLDGSGTPIELSGPLVAGGNVWDSQPPSSSGFEISPDGQRVAYLADQLVDEQFELFLRPIDGSGPAERVNDPLVPGGDVLPAFAFTVDGTGIAYRADQESDEVIELFLRTLP